MSHPGPDEPSIPDELLALVYLILLDEENLKAIQDSHASLPSRSKLATVLVGQVLVSALQEREREYGTTLEEDETLLQTGNLLHRTALAVQVRLGEKNVIRAAINEAQSFAGSNKRMRLQEDNTSLGGGGKAKRTIEETTHPKKRGKFN